MISTHCSTIWLCNCELPVMEGCMGGHLVRKSASSIEAAKACQEGHRRPCPCSRSRAGAAAPELGDLVAQGAHIVAVLAAVALRLGVLQLLPQRRLRARPACHRAFTDDSHNTRFGPCPSPDFQKAVSGHLKAQAVHDAAAIPRHALPGGSAVAGSPKAITSQGLTFACHSPAQHEACRAQAFTELARNITRHCIDTNYWPFVRPLCEARFLHSVTKRAWPPPAPP